MTLTPVIIIAALFVGTAVFAILWLVSSAAARNAASLLDAERRIVETLRTELGEKTVEAVRAEAETARLREKAESDRQEFEKLHESMRFEFRNLANDILEEKSKQFKETNRESLDLLLKPFRDNITEFRKRVEDIYSDENRRHGMLRNELQNLMELNRLITKETTNLTNALRGSGKVQGDWGEMILEKILEDSGLRREVHYTVQENLRDAEGNNLRPDVILHLPEGKHIVIDSKVSLTAFVGYAGDEDTAKCEAYLKEHLASVRRHVSELHSKNYQSLVDSPDFVIMFIPNEPAYLTSLGKDASLWTEAYNKKVIISSPTNLFSLLKIVYDLWKRADQSRNALRIAEAGGRLYDKFVGFVASLEDIGLNIDRAQKSYDKAYGQLKSGRGSLVTQSEKLHELGVKASKKLPPQLADTSGGEEPETEDLQEEP